MQLDAGEATVVIDPEKGGRIVSISVRGHSILVPPQPDSQSWGMYPTWHHAFEGGSFERPWETEASGRLRLDLAEAGPFEGHALQSFALTPSGLVMRLELVADRLPFPCRVGWHAWLLRDIGVGSPLALEAGGINLRRGPQLRWGDALTLTLRSGARHLGFGTPKTQNALCLEIQSDPPHALPLAPTILPTERPLSLEIAWLWELD